MKKTKLLFILAVFLTLCYSGSLKAQVIFSLDSKSGMNSSVVVIPVTVNNFTDIATTQFSVNWDASVISFVATEDYAFNSITGNSFGSNSVNTGNLTFSWYATSAISQTLNDGDTLFSVRFSLSGTAGTNSTVNISGSPIVIEVTNSNYEELGVAVNPGNVEIEGAPDTEAPSVPTGLSANVISSSQIDLSWNASSDNVGVTGYKIYRDGVELTTVTGTSYSNSGLTPETIYSYQVSAVDAAGNESALCAAVTATTLSTPDTEAPSIPAGLNATAVSSSKINLSWNASTDNVGVTGYKIYRGGVELTTVTGTSYSNSGLTPETEYSYQVSAVDAAGNESVLCVAVTATTQSTPDTEAPSIPSGLNATTVSSSQIDLSWNASTDNVGVTGYKIYRGGVELTTVTGTSYSNSGLTPETEYSYQVSAVDAAGNESVLCVAVTATTQSTPDTEAPSIPSGLNATAVSSSQIDLSWNASTDNVGATGYKIYRDGVELTTVTGTSYSNSGLTPETEYSYQVSAVDAAENESDLCAAVAAMTRSEIVTENVVFNLENKQGANNAEVIVPVTVQNFTDIATAQFSVNWDAGVLSYVATEDYAFNSITGSSFGTNSVDAGNLTFSWYATSAASQTLNDGDTLFSVRFNLDGTAGTNSRVNITGSPIVIEVTNSDYQELNVTVNSGLVEIEETPDTEAPSIPSGLNATAVSSSQIDLSWDVSTDNVGVTGYKIYRGGVELTAVTGTSYSNSGLTPETEYSYQVSAVDAAGNESVMCAAVTATTLSTPDTEAPSIPSGLNATAVSSSQIDLSWDASTDNVGVTGYKIYRGGVELTTVTGTSYSNSGLTPETEYSYQVSAVDAAGNESILCAAVTAITKSETVTKKVGFNLESKQGANNTEVIVPVTVQNFTDIATAQFSVNWDVGVISYVAAEDYAFNSITGYSFGTNSVDAGRLTFSWNATDAASQTLNDGDTLFSLRFYLDGTAGASSTVNITGSPIVIEVTNSNYEELGVNVNPGLVKINGVSGIDAPTNLTGLKAYPNPFRESLTIDFSLALNENVILTIVDVSGRIMESFMLDGKTGINSIKWNPESKISSGFYYVQLKGYSINRTFKVNYLK